MSRLSQDTGRVEQKRRTRRSLVEAAVELLGEGSTPTVAEAAGRAGVSKATGYRYFPTREVLLGEASVHAGTSPVADAKLLDAAEEEGDDPAERVRGLVRRLGEFSFENLALLRTSLRLSLDPESGYERPGHRLRWIADALAPLRGRVDEETLRRLSAALTLVLGIDPVVVLTDIAGLEREEALEVLEWAAGALVGAAVPPPAPASSCSSSTREERPVDTDSMYS